MSGPIVPKWLAVLFLIGRYVLKCGKLALFIGAIALIAVLVKRCGCV